MSESNGNQSNDQKPKLADGLFKPYTLGSTLTQTQNGNTVINTKSSPMDYEKVFQDSSKNQSITAEELAKLGQEQVKKAKESNFDKLKNKLAREKNPPNDPAAVAAKIGREKLGEKEMARRSAEGRAEHAKKSMTEDEILAAIPEADRTGVIAEMEKRIEEAKKSNNESEASKIEKAKEKAKKCWMPGADYGKN